MFMNKIFKLTQQPSGIIARHLHKRKFIWYDEGIQYPGFKYYPRNPDFKDPPYEATKLFRVQRLKPLKGCPYWEVEILKSFKLDGKKSECAVIKNIPENNAKLWRIKHLVEIVPITFPDGFPTENDHTYLHENGELRIIKSVQPIEKQALLAEEFLKLPKRLDGDIVRRNLRKRWMNAFDTIY